MTFFNPAKKHNKLLHFILLGSFCMFTFSGCSVKYVKGDYIRKEEIHGSKKNIGKKYTLQILNLPTLSEPQLTIGIKEIPKYQIKYNTINSQLKYVRENDGTFKGGAIIILLSVFVLSLSTIGMFGWGQVDDLTAEEKENSKKLGYTLGGISLATLILGGTMMDQNWKYSGLEGVVKGDPITKTQYGTSRELKNFNVQVSYKKGEVKEFTSDSEGKVHIKMVQDFDLRSFESVENIDFIVYSKETNIKEVIGLNPKDWTNQFIQINNDRAALREYPNQTSKVLKYLSSGSEFKVNNEFKDYYQVLINDQPCYVSKQYANSFWSVPERLDPKNPPKLIVKHVEFSDPSNDKFLDAEESGTFKVYLKNIGRGSAYRVGLKVNSNEKNTSQLSYPAYVNVGTIKPGESKTIEVVVNASAHTKDGKTTFQLNAKEANGFDAQPVNLTLQKRAFRPPVLEMADYGIDDANKNGRIELGEAFDVTVRIRNKGTGTAKRVTVQVNLDKSARNIFYDGYTNNFELNELKPGEFKDVKFSVLTNNRYNMHHIPVTITLNESEGKYGSSIPLNLPLDRSVKNSREFIITGKYDNTPVFNPIDELTPDVDINIPTTKNKNPNAVAVIIGLSKYQNRDIPQVDYARRDAETIKEYLIKTFGYDKKRIIEFYDDAATLAKFKQVFEEQLPNYVNGSDVFIYYSGHGVPDVRTEDAYFAPYDFNPSFTKSTGYKLSSLYSALRRLEAKSVTVALDACFSGVSDGGPIYKGMSPINIRVKNDAIGIHNGVVLTSSTGSQVSSWYHDKKHGLFTYFFLKGLRGDADRNNDNKITVQEMDAFLSAKVSDTARFNNREQTPQVFGNPERVLLKY
jgi:hypothetical protein